MSDVDLNLSKAYESVIDKINNKPEIAIILGSGLGEFGETIDNKTYINYNDIDNFPVSTVSGHAGRFILGKIGDKNVICMQGRVHYYEGYTMDKVVLPVRLMKLLGADTLILTNAAGGINKEFNPGDLMAITDHITSFVPSPLIGKNIDSLGTRFPDMSEVYSNNLLSIMDKTAEKLLIPLKHGVYLQTTGPNYETPAEINMYKLLGADTVGMSTACEAMAAKHMGMNIAGISCITNMASGISNTPLSHSEVKENADRTAAIFQHLLREFILSI
ncbi:MAG: purine-nucleoside phosphorylase [Lachnospiraceae bacterium]|nr:purine-nucleoside phosphorylase [Lachnospiraceae bacterium]MBQ9608762.1 purine-nucleoside phosphorylase [Lachnospiraceae bacterium]